MEVDFFVNKYQIRTFICGGEFSIFLFYYGKFPKFIYLGNFSVLKSEIFLKSEFMTIFKGISSKLSAKKTQNAKKRQ